jgi:hypothetical protein
MIRFHFSSWLSKIPLCTSTNIQIFYAFLLHYLQKLHHSNSHYSMNLWTSFLNTVGKSWITELIDGFRPIPNYVGLGGPFNCILIFLLFPTVGIFNYSRTLLLS